MFESIYLNPKLFIRHAFGKLIYVRGFQGLSLSLVLDPRWAVPVVKNRSLRKHRRGRGKPTCWKGPGGGRAEKTPKRGHCLIE